MLGDDNDSDNDDDDDDNDAAAADDDDDDDDDDNDDPMKEEPVCCAQCRLTLSSLTMLCSSKVLRTFITLKPYSLILFFVFNVICVTCIFRIGVYVEFCVLYPDFIP